MICRNCEHYIENPNNPKIVCTGYHQLGPEWHFNLSFICAVTRKPVKEDHQCDCLAKKAAYEERMAEEAAAEKQKAKKERNKAIASGMSIPEEDHQNLHYAYPLFRCGPLSASQKREIKNNLSRQIGKNTNDLYLDFSQAVPLPNLQQLMSAPDEYYFDCHSVSIQEDETGTILLFSLLGRKKENRFSFVVNSSMMPYKQIEALIDDLVEDVTIYRTTLQDFEKTLNSMGTKNLNPGTGTKKITTHPRPDSTILKIDHHIIKDHPGVFGRLLVPLITYIEPISTKRVIAHTKARS